MKHLFIFEEFEARDIVNYNGKRSRILAKSGDKYDIVVLRGGQKLTVNEDELEPSGRCMGRCDRRVIAPGKIFCFGCDRNIN